MTSQYPERKTKLMNYVSWSLKMGDGKLQGSCKDLIEVPPQMVCNLTDELEDNIFDDFANNMNNVKYLFQRATMPSRNDFIDKEKNPVHGKDSWRNED